MVRHYTPANLERLLLEPTADEALVEGAVQHLWRCDRCWAAAVEIVDRRKAELLPHTNKARSVLLSLVQGEERATVAELRAKGLWSELRHLTHGEQLKRIRSVASLQSIALFEVMIAEARDSGPSDPHAGEHTANLALSLAGLLPEHRVPARIKRDLEGGALTIVANLRRLLANWPGSFQAINAAEQHLAEGTGDPDRAAMLSEIHALLAMDTGNFEAGLGHSGRALGLYRQLKDWVSVARAAVIEASIRLASGQYDEAIGKADLALGLIGPGDANLELLSRGIIIESYVLLGRPVEALHLFRRAKPLFEKPGNARVRLRVGFLEACILEGLGSVREAEKLFKEVAQGFMDSDLHKDAFMTLLTLFEALCRRGALDKAARLCQAAIENTAELAGAPKVHIREVWQKLLGAIQLGQLQQADLENARLFFVRYWNMPPKEGVKALQQAREATILPAAPIPRIPAPPPVPQALDAKSYKVARESYDRDLVASALRETGGNLSEASRRLGMSRMTLRAKVRQYGLMHSE